MFHRASRNAESRLRARFSEEGLWSTGFASQTARCS